MRRRIVAKRISALCVVVRRAKRTVGGAFGAGNIVAADRNAVEDCAMLCCKGVKPEIGLALPAKFLIDECKDSRESSNRSGCAANLIHHQSLFGCNAFGGRLADWVEAVVGTDSGKEGDIRDIAYSVSWDASASLPHWLGVTARAR